MFPVDICPPCGEGPSAENIEQRGEVKGYTEVGNQNRNRKREERGAQDRGKEKERIYERMLTSFESLVPVPKAAESP